MYRLIGEEWSPAEVVHFLKFVIELSVVYTMYTSVVRLVYRYRKPRV